MDGLCTLSTVHVLIDFLPTGCPGEGYLSVKLIEFEHRNEREMDAG